MRREKKREPEIWSNALKRALDCGIKEGHLKFTGQHSLISLAVINDEGDVIGQLSRSILAEAFIE